VVTATVAGLLALGSMTSYLAGASRLGATLARDGALPSWLAKGHRPGEVPRRSLGLLALLSMCVSIWAISTRAELGAIMLAASACFIAVTVAGLIAGIRLLPRDRPVWYGAVGASVAMSVVLLFSGAFLAVPGLLSVAALLYTASRRQTDTSIEAEPASTMNARTTHADQDDVLGAIWVWSEEDVRHMVKQAGLSDVPMSYASSGGDGRLIAMTNRIVRVLATSGNGIPNRRTPCSTRAARVHTTASTKEA